VADRLRDAAELADLGSVRLRWIREADNPPGMAPVDAWVTIDTDDGSWHMLVRPGVDDAARVNALLRVVAAQIEAAGETIREVEDLRRERDRALSRLRQARETLCMWARGEAFFGRVRLRWELSHGCALWLEDPERGTGGYAIGFATPDELWARYPQLRPVDAGRDERGPWVDLEPVRLRIQAEVARG